jgi:hypothetical protein
MNAVRSVVCSGSELVPSGLLGCRYHLTVSLSLMIKVVKYKHPYDYSRLCVVSLWTRYAKTTARRSCQAHWSSAREPVKTAGTCLALFTSCLCGLHYLRVPTLKPSTDDVTQARGFFHHVCISILHCTVCTGFPLHFLRSIMEFLLLADEGWQACRHLLRAEVTRVNLMTWHTHAHSHPGSSRN